METSHNITKEETKMMNEKCTKVTGDAEYMKADFTAYSMNVTCDADTFTSTVFSDYDCKGTNKTLAIEWGVCTDMKIGEQSVYYTLTNAVALQVAAAATLAFVGSQF